MSDTPDQPPADLSRAVLCPHCGYDNRGTTGGLCSECGGELDRAAVRNNPMPWASRGRLGRVRAFLSTWWMVTVDSRRIAMALSAEHTGRDAEKFRLVVGWLAGIGLAGAFLVLILLDGSLPWSGKPSTTPGNMLQNVFRGIVQREGEDRAWNRLFVKPDDIYRDDRVWPFSEPAEPWQWKLMEELRMPWSASYPPVTVTLGLLLLGMALARMAGRPRSRGRLAGAAEKAMGCYAVAPLSALLLLPLAMAGIVSLTNLGDGYRGVGNIIFGLTLLFTLACVALSVRRVLRWEGRSAVRGIAFFADAGLLLRLFAVTVFLLYVVPWSLGVIRLVIDSLS